MRSKEEIIETIKTQCANVRERGQIAVQALKVRADVAATRQRLRSTFAELGEAVYAQLSAGKAVDFAGELGDFKLRIEGLKAEIRQREKDLREIVEGDAVAEAEAPSENDRLV